MTVDRRHVRRTALVVGAVAVAVGLAGCGGNDVVDEPAASAVEIDESDVLDAADVVDDDALAGIRFDVRRDPG